MNANFNSRYWQLWEEIQDIDSKITRLEFANYMGVTLGQSNGWLDKGNQPDCDTLRKIAKKAGVSVSWLVGETEIRNFQINRLLDNLSSPIIDEIARYTSYLIYKEKENEKLKKKFLKDMK